MVTTSVFPLTAFSLTSRSGPVSRSARSPILATDKTVASSPSRGGASKSCRSLGSSLRSAASIYVHVFGAPGLFDLLGGWSVLLPRFTLRPALGAADVATIVAAVTIPYLVAAAIPAWRAATLEPDEAMRG